MFDSYMNIPKEDTEGQSDERPITPQGITAFEFTNLLNILNAK